MRKPGFVMIYTLSAIAVTGLLVTTLAMTTNRGFTLERERERGLDEILIAQDVMEREKYNHRFGGEPSLSSETVRNGKTYKITIHRRPRMVEGVPMIEISCEVQGKGSEVTRLVTLMEER